MSVIDPGAIPTNESYQPDISMRFAEGVQVILTPECVASSGIYIVFGMSFSLKNQITSQSSRRPKSGCGLPLAHGRRGLSPRYTEQLLSALSHRSHTHLPRSTFWLQKSHNLKPWSRARL